MLNYDEVDRGFFDFSDDMQIIQTTLEEALVKIAEEKWQKLVANLRSSDSRDLEKQYVEKSLRSLKRLQEDGMPNYDEWDSLFYFTYYQPRQVNLAFSILCAMRTDRDIFESENRKIRFIDYGCGCLATIFAVSMAAADSISRGIHIEKIKFDFYDKNTDMINAGEEIWGEFVKAMRTNYPKHPVTGVLNKILYKTHTSLSTMRENYEACYLTSFHCIYSENIDDVSLDIGRLLSQFKPVGVILTTDSIKKDCLNRLKLKVSGKYHQLPINNLTSQFNGDLVKVTNWRRGLKEKWTCNKHEHALWSNYLEGKVFWNGINKAAYYVYIDRTRFDEDELESQMALEYYDEYGWMYEGN